MLLLGMRLDFMWGREGGYFLVFSGVVVVFSSDARLTFLISKVCIIRKGVVQASVEDWILSRCDWVQRKRKMGWDWEWLGSCLSFPRESAGCKEPL